MSQESKKPVISATNKLRRKENRFTYTMPISVRTMKYSYQATTINVSSAGMKFVIPSNPKTSISKLDFIYIMIPELNDYLDSFLADEEQVKIRERFIYQVVHMQFLKEETIIACESVGHSISDLLMLESYIEDKLQSCHVDQMHELNNIKYSFYEYLRFDNISELIYYYIPKEENCLFVESEKNRFIYGYLTAKDQTKPDLSPFLSPSFLAFVAKQNNIDFDFYLFFFWGNDKLHFKYSFEINTQQELNQLLQQIVVNHGYILKGYSDTISLSDVDDVRVFVTSELNHKEAVHQVIFYDVTKFINQCSYELLALNKIQSYDFPEIVAKTEENFSYQCFLFNSHCQRFENRHLFKTGISVIYNENQIVNGESIDFSYSGLSLSLAKKADDFSLGSTILVDFTTLNKQMKKLELTKIPFIIKNVVVSPFSNQTQLGLLRSSSHCHTNINQFFDVIVEKNRMKLPLCTQDKLSFLDKQLIQKRYRESLRSIPIFLAYNEKNEFSIKEIKIYNKNCRLARFFKVNDQYDFSCLTRQLLLQKFSEYISVKSYHAKPFLAFLIRMNNEIKIVTNDEIKDKPKLKRIAENTIAKKGICVLINFNENRNFNEQAFEYSFNKHSHAEQAEIEIAKEKVKDICGYMELTDITSFFEIFLA